jgi:hypothetical protein
MKLPDLVRYSSGLTRSMTFFDRSRVRRLTLAAVAKV